MVRFDPNVQSRQLIGTLTQEVVDLVGGGYKPGPIYIGPSNIRHMRSKHPAESAKYLGFLPDIIANPDNTGCHPRDQSLQYFKQLDDMVLVAVRVTKGGILYARSLYIVLPDQFEEYQRAGTIYDYPKKA